ncbi:hypothetical protein BCS71_19885 [Vibrio lentus]|uniref:hypothetical protein n=1 Tax=Vibrio TaxID=662 RepID=UPI00030E20CA|nr:MULTISPECIES: hypothetical protein [Vibrio]PMI57467.1 hypothetical protein BCU41_00500 [Vibrio lentus]PMJ01081.1 hypothetical protein BCU32_09180 [Vibrio lentus]
MAEVKMSQIQKAMLSCFAKAFTKGVKEDKSTVIDKAVNHLLQKDTHPNNFRVSCKTLEERGLIMRKKVDLDWYINITPERFELALS